MKIEHMVTLFIKLIPQKKVRAKLKKYYLKKCRLKQILEDHKKTSEYLTKNYIKKYINQELLKYPVTPKKQIATDKIIWQFWAQGVDEKTPKIVKACLDSVKKYSNGYKVIVLTLDTIKEYIDLPEILYDKLANNEEFKTAFFADMLRLYLLSAYGGVWIDATILLTAPIDSNLLAKDFFMYQRDKQPENYTEWEDINYDYFSWTPGYCVNVLNSFIIAKKHNVIIEALKDILTAYWNSEDKFIHYFLFQILFNELIKIEPYKSANCIIMSDLLPHLMHKHIYNQYTDTLWNFITSKSNIHKLTYYVNIPQTSILEKILLDNNKPYLIKPISDCTNITFCTMLFNLKSKNLNKIKKTKRNFETFYLQSLKILCQNYKNIVLWCDKETSDFLEKNKITNIHKKVIELDELPLFNNRNEHLNILKKMKKQSFNEGYLLKDLSPEEVIDYVMLVHSKIEVIKWAKDNNFYNTDYFYWIDAGTNNPVYFRIWQNWDGKIDVKTKKCKCVFMTTHSKILHSIIQLADFEDIALIKAPFEIAAGMFVLNKNIVDEFYQVYKETYKFLMSKKLFTTEQSIFSAMVKRGYGYLFEFSRSYNYVDIMNLVAKPDNVYEIVNNKLKILYKKLLLQFMKTFCPLKTVNKYKQKKLYK